MKIQRYILIVSLVFSAAAGQCAVASAKKPPVVPEGLSSPSSPSQSAVGKKKMELEPLPDEGAEYQPNTPASDEPYDEIGEEMQEPEDREGMEEPIAPDVKVPAKSPAKVPVQAPAKEPKN